MLRAQQYDFPSESASANKPCAICHTRRICRRKCWHSSTPCRNSRSVPTMRQLLKGSMRPSHSTLSVWRQAFDDSITGVAVSADSG